jgi:hypothetical protein
MECFESFVAFPISFHSGDPRFKSCCLHPFFSCHIGKSQKRIQRQKEWRAKNRRRRGINMVKVYVEDEKNGSFLRNSRQREKLNTL